VIHLAAPFLLGAGAVKVADRIGVPVAEQFQLGRSATELLARYRSLVATPPLVA